MVARVFFFLLYLDGPEVHGVGHDLVVVGVLRGHHRMVEDGCTTAARTRGGTRRKTKKGQRNDARERGGGGEGGGHQQKGQRGYRAAYAFFSAGL